MSYGEYVPKKKPKRHQDQYEVTTQPWDQLPDESEVSFDAFKVYKNQGFSRSLEKVAAFVYEEQWESNFRYVKHWSVVHRWDERADAWDLHIRKYENDIIESAGRQAEMQMIDSLPDITDQAVGIALGRVSGDRVQAGMINSIYDRVGPSKRQVAQNQTNIYNNQTISAPALPGEIAKEYSLEEAEYEDISKDAEALIPEHLRNKK